MNDFFLLINVILLQVTLIVNAAAEVRELFDSDHAKVVLLGYNKGVLRTIDDEKLKLSKEEKLVRSQHKRKMREIIEYMKDHMISTNYFYEEMKRIQKQRQVKGVLRDMVVWLEQPDHSEIKYFVLECFKHGRDHYYQKSHVDLWKQPTNNLVVNVFRDPYNNGVLN